MRNKYAHPGLSAFIVFYTHDVYPLNFTEGVKPLHTAVMSDSESVCTRVLLENAVQAEVEVDEEKDTGECALAVAARLGNVACTATLLGFGASVDKIDTLNGWTPLHYACFHDKPAVVRLLLQAGADASRLDKYGKAPLHMAAFNGSVDVLGHLLDFKAVPCKNADGMQTLPFCKESTTFLKSFSVSSLGTILKGCVCEYPGLFKRWL